MSDKQGMVCQRQKKDASASRSNNASRGIRQVYVERHVSI
jgi:hypothetical protein